MFYFVWVGIETFAHWRQLPGSLWAGVCDYDQFWSLAGSAEAMPNFSFCYVTSRKNQLFCAPMLYRYIITVVPALGDPRRERPPAVYGHFVNVPTHFNVKLPVISGHLPNADADSHLLVVSTCYNGQCKQMPRFRWSFQPKIACAHPNVRPSVLSNFRAVVW